MARWVRCMDFFAPWMRSAKCSGLSTGRSLGCFPLFFYNTAHAEDKVIIDGLQKSETKRVGPKAKDADLRIPIWEETHMIRQEGMDMEVQHDLSLEEGKAEMSLFEHFVSQRNEKAAKRWSDDGWR